MLTLPVVQLVNSWTGDLNIDGSIPVWDKLTLNPTFAGFRRLSVVYIMLP